MPPPAQPEKDRTLTRRTVAGAAGGLKGVDYEDNRRADPSTIHAEARSPKAAKLVREARSGDERVHGISELADRNKVIVPVDPGFITRDDEPIVDEVPKKKNARRRAGAARDRFSVDKDAPELLRARKWTEDDEEEEARDEEELELEVSDEDDILERDTPSQPRAHLFCADEKPEPGDLALTDPDEIARVLGSPLAYAKHSMILAEAFRRRTGATRAEAIEYLARMFIAPSDRSFGRLAIKEFGPSSGIIDIYPLEVVEHVLERYPGFLPKVGFGRLFANVPIEEETIFVDTKTPVILEYPAELKIRSFAISGGGRPGYLLEPDLEPGKYRLHIYTSGKYRVLISGVNQHGYTTIDRLRVQVKPRSVEDLATTGGDEEYYPARSEAAVQAWPVPVIDMLAEDLSADDIALLEEAVCSVIDEAAEIARALLELPPDDESEITQRIMIDDLDLDEAED